MTLDLCIFANFFIDNDERFNRMKDSFFSFKDTYPDQWVINIRGSLKFQAANFLKEQLGNKIKIFHLQSNRGWFYDSRVISKFIKSNYIFFWVEDHILINNSFFFKNCLLEMKKFKVDQMWYTFLTNEIKERFGILPIYKKGKYITVTKIDNDANVKMLNIYKKNFYTISMISIMEKNFFLKNIFSSKPYLKRWPRNLPFDFEKKSTDNVFSSIKHALPNKELFASIDDDRGEDGYSLISRGLYKSSISRENLKKKESLYSRSFSKNLKNTYLKKIVLFMSGILFFVKRLYFTVNIFTNNK